MTFPAISFGKKMMKTIAVMISCVLALTSTSFSQHVNSIKQAHEAENALLPNKHMVFARTPPGSNRPGNATQSFKGDDYIYARVFFDQSIQDALFLEAEEDQATVPADIYVEDITNHHSLYISLELEKSELSRHYFEFDVMPDPAHTTRASKEFETGRFSFFVSESSLENRKPIFKFTIGDATGYIQVDFENMNLQQIKARDFEAYEKALQVKEGEEKQ